ncbi:MAG TPA: chloride channel protein [Verrucomicrobiae bacterium]|jgi:H+/Cl- antiporter ClcA|nr:chloride channel protein [Verrucomicrobiae bacterium]
MQFTNSNSTPADSHSTDSLSDFTTDTRVLLLSAMALVIGAISAGVAWVLVRLIDLITNISFFGRFSTSHVTPEQAHLGGWVVLIPVVGAIIIGFMARYGSPKIRGHGIPEALEAILIGRSRIEPKVAVLKPISSAISIGTGGPFGAEGPIIMTGGACGSIFAQLFHLSAAERKTLLVAGAAGGMAAIFATPVAAVLISVELLLFEWKPRSFIPVTVSALIASILRVPLLGHGPIFPVLPHPAMTTLEMGVALFVGIAGGLTSGIVTTLVYAFEDLFKKVPVHWMWWPALGAIVVGFGGWLDPRVLGVGYDLIDKMLNGRLIGGLLIVLLVTKALVWAVALGSGTSGGVLAPLLIIGGALGAVLAPWIPAGDSGLWVMVGMAAVMGGTMRAPLTATVFTLELTHDLNALPAVLIGSAASLAVTVLMLRRSILTEKIARRGHHISCEYSVDLFNLSRVSDVMDKNPPTVPATMKLRDLSELIALGNAPLCRRQGTLIVDDEGHLAGIITRGDVVRALQQNGDVTVLEAGQRNLIVAYTDELLDDAITKMLRNDIGRLPVVERDNPRHVIGYLGRANILGARVKQIDEENLRERGRMRVPENAIAED